MASILICTGIYPPHIGGPAQYAHEVENELRRRGHKVRVLTYELERRLPTLVRHGLFFVRTCAALLQGEGADFILALDTFSIGWPATLAARMFGKKTLVRIGGDFLWEQYVERTGNMVLLSTFYDRIPFSWLSLKEKLIFSITRWTLHHVSGNIFSTAWQRRIFEKAYGLNPAKNFIVENFYGEKLPPVSKHNRVFVAGTRPLKWKNLAMLQKAFETARETDHTIQLDMKTEPYQSFLEKIRTSYAVVLASIGDISPNMILDAIRAGTPFILTKENGLTERVKDIAVFADPLSPQDIREKILYVADPKNYQKLLEKLAAFTFTHSWREICDEILSIANGLK